MNFDLTDDQEMMRDMFARFLDENSTTARVRAAAPSGFDATLWKGLAEQGALLRKAGRLRARRSSSRIRERSQRPETSECC